MRVENQRAQGKPAKNSRVQIAWGTRGGRSEGQARLIAAISGTRDLRGLHFRQYIGKKVYMHSTTVLVFAVLLCLGSTLHRFDLDDARVALTFSPLVRVAL